MGSKLSAGSTRYCSGLNLYRSRELFVIDLTDRVHGRLSSPEHTTRRQDPFRNSRRQYNHRDRPTMGYSAGCLFAVSAMQGYNNLVLPAMLRRFTDYDMRGLKSEYRVSQSTQLAGHVTDLSGESGGTNLLGRSLLSQMFDHCTRGTNALGSNQGDLSIAKTIRGTVRTQNTYRPHLPSTIPTTANKSDAISTVHSPKRV